MSSLPDKKIPIKTVQRIPYMVKDGSKYVMTKLGTHQQAIVFKKSCTILCR